MQLHELKGMRKDRSQRIGRGGKRGSYSGRGVKGQKSRAGRRIRPAVRDLVLRLPKRRGFRNKPKSPKAFTVNLSTLEQKLRPLRDGQKELTVDATVLAQAGIIPQDLGSKVKVLGGGELGFAITLKGIGASRSAKEKIAKAGGKVL